MVASGEGGGIGGRQNPTKGNARPLSVCQIVTSKYCGVRGGGGPWGAPKSYKGQWRPLSLSLR